MSYSVKNVKTFRGMEGYGFNATLYRDNKRVAHVDDEGNGGCYRYHWFDYEKPRVEVTYKTYDGKDWTRKATPEEAKFIEYLKSEGKDGEIEFEDCFVGELVDDYENNKRFKRYCKKETVFRLYGDDEGAWRTLKVPYSDPRAEKYLKDKYGDKIEEIMNKRFM